MNHKELLSIYYFYKFNPLDIMRVPGWYNERVTYREIAFSGFCGWPHPCPRDSINEDDWLQRLWKTRYCGHSVNIEVSENSNTFTVAIATADLPEIRAVKEIVYRKKEEIEYPM